MLHRPICDPLQNIVEFELVSRAWPEIYYVSNERFEGIFATLQS